VFKLAFVFMHTYWLLNVIPRAEPVGFWGFWPVSRPGHPFYSTSPQNYPSLAGAMSVVICRWLAPCRPSFVAGWRHCRPSFVAGWRHCRPSFVASVSVCAPRRCLCHAAVVQASGELVLRRCLIHWQTIGCVAVVSGTVPVSQRSRPTLITQLNGGAGVWSALVR